MQTLSCLIGTDSRYRSTGGGFSAIEYREEIMAKPKSVKPGKVQKIIPPPFPGVPEKAEIAVEGADHLYREIRIENTLEDEKGHEVNLKLGANVNVVVEADKAETVPK
jgi:hypothetical protein